MPLSATVVPCNPAADEAATRGAKYAQVIRQKALEMPLSQLLSSIAQTAKDAEKARGRGHVHKANALDRGLELLRQVADERRAPNPQQ